MSSTYSQIFQIKRVRTYDLQNPDFLDAMRERGFAYIRRVEFEYDSILRNPTIGCIVDLSIKPHFGSIPIDSVKGRKLIRKLSYY
jgi:hypothetical protein